MPPQRAVSTGAEQGWRRAVRGGKVISASCGSAHRADERASEGRFARSLAAAGGATGNNAWRPRSSRAPRTLRTPAQVRAPADKALLQLEHDGRRPRLGVVQRRGPIVARAHEAVPATREIATCECSRRAWRRR